MTDKELRKLSRLELLELLLEASKENRKLKEKINRLISENKTAQNIENLSVVTRQVENALMYANSLTDNLRSNAYEATPLSAAAKIDYPQQTEMPQLKSDEPSDKDIYLQMMCFFAKNDDKLKVFPEDIENVVRERIRNILERRTLN